MTLRSGNSLRWQSLTILTMILVGLLSFTLPAPPAHADNTICIAVQDSNNDGGAESWSVLTNCDSIAPATSYNNKQDPGGLAVDVANSQLLPAQAGGLPLPSGAGLPWRRALTSSRAACGWLTAARRMFSAAMWSASLAHPKATQQNRDWDGRLAWATCPHFGNVWDVSRGSTSSTGRLRSEVQGKEKTRAHGT
jgi:hypothetical protein